MLEYLPEDMETVIGQNELMNDFGKGAFSLVIVEDMPAKDVAALKEKISKVEHVDTVIWYDSIADCQYQWRCCQINSILHLTLKMQR